MILETNRWGEGIQKGSCPPVDDEDILRDEVDGWALGAESWALCISLTGKEVHVQLAPLLEERLHDLGIELPLLRVKLSAEAVGQAVLLTWKVGHLEHAALG